MEYKEIKHIYTKEFVTPVMGLSFVPSNPKACLFFQHGFSSHIREYRHVGEFFAKNNIAVHMIDMPGHGLSSGERGNITSFSEYTDTFSTFIDLLDTQLPIFISGHSMGSLIAIDYALQTKRNVQGAVLLAPLLGLNLGLNLVLSGISIAALYGKHIRMPYPLIPFMARKRHAKRYDEMFSDPLRGRVITSTWSLEIQKKIKAIQKQAKNYTTPSMYILAQCDKIVSNQDVLKFAKNTNVSEKTTHVFTNVEHEMLHENEADQILSLMLSWINKKLNV